ncbi:Hypothetical protein FKW44_017162 [Caligus rogercresseyi]|uniref:Uncharacterized protein n=1 Tax=Caligus rogercresseyi TaxID=217165 RepID=A0A7T8H304_CALRO|nr:Hypothetical protein FKW44_017162 [Caligus rogercresseyi]
MGLEREAAFHNVSQSLYPLQRRTPLHAFQGGQEAQKGIPHQITPEDKVEDKNSSWTPLTHWKMCLSITSTIVLPRQIAPLKRT